MESHANQSCNFKDIAFTAKKETDRLALHVVAVPAALIPAGTNYTSKLCIFTSETFSRLWPIKKDLLTMMDMA